MVYTELLEVDSDTFKVVALTPVSNVYHLILSFFSPKLICFKNKNLRGKKAEGGGHGV